MKKNLRIELHNEVINILNKILLLNRFDNSFYIQTKIVEHKMIITELTTGD